jgi:hypothetical protein
MDKEVLKILREKKSESSFLTVECLLAFDKDENKGRVLSTMRKFSSMVKFAYKRLMEGQKTDGGSGKERAEKTTIPQVWNKHQIFGRCDSSCKTNSGILPRRKAKSQKACFWFKRTV